MNKNNDKAFFDGLFRRAKEDRNFRKSLVARSFYLFAVTYFSEAMYDPSAAFQKEMYQLAEREEGILVVAAFRGSGKSLVFTQCFPLYAVMTRGVHNVVIFSATQRQAQDHLANIRYSLESNALLKKDFGPFSQKTDARGRSSLIISGYDAKITAASIETSVRGLKYKHYRPQLLVADDIEDINSVRTAEGRDKVFHFLQSEVILLGGPGTRLIFVGNLLHPDSAIMRLKQAIEDNRIDGVFRMYPLQDEDGNILWPERFTPKVLAAERRKYIDDIDWEREMNLRFVSAPDMVVKREWIETYKRPPDGGYVAKFAIGVDPAISKRQTADYTAIVSVVVCNSGDETKLYVCSNPFNQRIDFPEALKEIKRRHDVLASGMRRVEVYIEDVAYQAALPQYLKNSGGMRVEGFKIPLDKRGKFSVLGDLIKKKKIIFPETGCELLIEQLVGYGKERHDDLADALAIVAFAVFPDPYPKITIPRKVTWAGMDPRPLSAEEFKQLEHEEDLRLGRESEKRRRFGLSFEFCSRLAAEAEVLSFEQVATSLPPKIATQDYAQNDFGSGHA